MTLGYQEPYDVASSEAQVDLKGIVYGGNMPAPQVRSDRDQLKQIQSMFSSEAERVASFWRDLVSKDETLRGGDWIGEGAMQFYNEMNGEVYPHLKKLYDALNDAAKTTGDISKLMEDLEANTSKKFVWRLA